MRGTTGQEPVKETPQEKHTHASFKRGFSCRRILRCKFRNSSAYIVIYTIRALGVWSGTSQNTLRERERERERMRENAHTCFHGFGLFRCRSLHREGKVLMMMMMMMMKIFISSRIYPYDEEFSSGNKCVYILYIIQLGTDMFQRRA